jgi:aminopeptidase N
MSTAKPSRFRLPTDVRPSSYDLYLEPDLDAGRFRGEVTIALRLDRSRSAITLHAADMKIGRVVARYANCEVTGRAKLERVDETAVLTFQSPLPAGGVSVTIGYSAELNKHLRGFYAASADGRRYAFTQCEAADARRVLPCFDEPAFKARFRTSVKVRDGETAVSNSPVEREEAVAGGRSRPTCWPSRSDHSRRRPPGCWDRRRSVSGTSRARAA